MENPKLYRGYDWNKWNKYKYGAISFKGDGRLKHVIQGVNTW